jgi:hypothetical protein
MDTIDPDNLHNNWYVGIIPCQGSYP